MYNNDNVDERDDFALTGGIENHYKYQLSVLVAM